MPFMQENHLLNALPAEIQRRLIADMKLVTLEQGTVVCEAGDAMSHVYFPTNSIVSLQSVTEDGASTEISVVGCEGMVGVALFMGGESAQIRAVVESSGSAYRLSAQVFKDEFNQHSEMMMLMLRYTQTLLTQMAQNALCNRHHSVQQQVCRWLLRSLDRLPGNHLAMTQEFIANLLGVRREGVTDAAGKLQKRGVIEYNRGHITVLDRSMLEQLSCECYAAVKKETDRLLPQIDFSSSPALGRMGAVAHTRAIASGRLLAVSPKRACA